MVSYKRTINEKNKGDTTMKKYLTLILTAALALPAFSCGSESAGGNDTTTAAGSSC